MRPLREVLKDLLVADNWFDFDEDTFKIYFKPNKKQLEGAWNKL